MKKGFLKVRVDGEIKNILDDSYLSVNSLELDRNKHHDIELLIDDLLIKKENKSRIKSSCDLAINHGNGSILIIEENSTESFFYSTKLMCPKSGISYSEPEPNTFSFNSPQGYCINCKGLGNTYLVDEKKIIVNENLSINSGAIELLDNIEEPWILNELKIILEKYNFGLDTPVKKISRACLDSILYGIKGNFKIQKKELGLTKHYEMDFPGISKFILNEFKIQIQKEFKDGPKII